MWRCLFWYTTCVNKVLWHLALLRRPEQEVVGQARKCLGDVKEPDAPAARAKSVDRLLCGLSPQGLASIEPCGRNIVWASDIPPLA